MKNNSKNFFIFFFIYLVVETLFKDVFIFITCISTLFMP